MVVMMNGSILNIVTMMVCYSLAIMLSPSSGFISTSSRPSSRPSSSTTTTGTGTSSGGNIHSHLLSAVTTTKPPMTGHQQYSSTTRISSKATKITTRSNDIHNNDDDSYDEQQEREREKLYNEIYEKVQLITLELWKEDEIIPCLQKDSSSSASSSSSSVYSIEGEAELVGMHPTIDMNFSNRCSYFKKKAIHVGCPKSQHSYGLLLWNGFATCDVVDDDVDDNDDNVGYNNNNNNNNNNKNNNNNAVLSAKFHAAAAYQHHLDGLAILGGIIRTGTGIPKKMHNVEFGILIINYCASVGNPTGINKKAALLEEHDNYIDAVQLYEHSLSNERTNALLLFNLGWCFMNGLGSVHNKKDTIRGLQLWKDATELAPDEGSEEAAWFLYKEYERDNPIEAQHYYDLAIDLGYYE